MLKQHVTKFDVKDFEPTSKSWLLGGQKLLWGHLCAEGGFGAQRKLVLEGRASPAAAAGELPASLGFFCASESHLPPSSGSQKHRQKTANRGPFTLKHLYFRRTAKDDKHLAIWGDGFLFLMLRWNLGRRPSGFRERRSFEGDSDNSQSAHSIKCAKCEMFFFMCSFPLKYKLTGTYLVQVLCVSSARLQHLSSGGFLDHHSTPLQQTGVLSPDPLQKRHPVAQERMWQEQERVLNAAEPERTPARRHCPCTDPGPRPAQLRLSLCK